LAARTREVSDELGFSELETNVGVQDSDTLKYAAATPFARQVLRWQLKKLGLKVKEHRESGWSDDDDDIWLTLRDPEQAGKPIKERFDVRVLADDPAQGERLLGWLRDAGFRCRPLELLSDEQAHERAFALSPGPFGADRAPGALSRLTILVHDLVSDARV